MIRDDKGFALVESLISLAIAGLIGAAALSAAIGSETAVRRQRLELEVFLAAELLRARLGLDLPVTVAGGSGRLGDRVAWSATVAPVPLQWLPPARSRRAVQTVTITVRSLRDPAVRLVMPVVIGTEAR